MKNLHAGIATPPNPNTVETFTAFVSQEVQKWATVVKQSGTETQWSGRCSDV